MFVSRRSELNDYLIKGVLLSLLVHLALFLTVSIPEKFVERPPLVINIIPPQAALKPRQPLTKQIVSPTTTAESPDSDINTPFESDQNRKVEKEVIRRGQGEDAGIPGPTTREKTAQNPPPAAVKQKELSPPRDTQKAPPAPPAKTNPQTQTPPKQRATGPLKHLKLDTADLLKKFERSKETPRQGKRDLLNELQNPAAGYQAFNRPYGSGARFLGNQGTNDHLPHLPDGDITMLNTKANRFAVFVRRVATQVFSQLRSSGWESLLASDVRGIREFSTVHAVLSLDGKLLDVRLEGSSGSQSFDRVVIAAVKAGARDPHPPEKAVAEDGNIHFIFQAKSWSRTVPRGRDGGVMERRWLLLGTGLQ